VIPTMTAVTRGLTGDKHPGQGSVASQPAAGLGVERERVVAVAAGRVGTAEEAVRDCCVGCAGVAAARLAS
jgi:hypothetical protein